jgi:tetratricopeptide (TPR) repeat protein
MKKNWLIGLFVFWVVFGTNTLSHAKKGGPDGLDEDSPDDLYAEAVRADAHADIQKALKLFTEALQLDPNNPDILNGLAHTQLEAGLLDDAMMNGWFAEKLRPNFPQAREVLGEAYLRGLLKEIDGLKNEGGKGEEQLAILMKAFNDVTAQVNASK